MEEQNSTAASQPGKGPDIKLIGAILFLLLSIAGLGWVLYDVTMDSDKEPNDREVTQNSDDDDTADDDENAAADGADSTDDTDTELAREPFSVRMQRGDTLDTETPIYFTMSGLLPSGATLTEDEDGLPSFKITGNGFTLVFTDIGGPKSAGGFTHLVEVGPKLDNVEAYSVPIARILGEGDDTAGMFTYYYTEAEPVSENDYPFDSADCENFAGIITEAPCAYNVIVIEGAPQIEHSISCTVTTGDVTDCDKIVQSLKMELETE